MKKSVFILGCTLWGVSLSAQNENVQYQLLEGYSSSRAFNPKHIAVPDLPGYKTLKCDFHLHTYYSMDMSLLKCVYWRLGLKD